MAALIRALVRNDTFGRFMLILVGSIISGAGVQAFLVPAKLVPAGLSGLAVLASYVAPVPAGLLLLALNVPIFYLGWKKADRDFVKWSLFGMLGFTLSLQLSAPLAELHLIKDWYLGGITGAVVVGFGTGLVFRVRGSQGGTDIVAAVIRKRVAVGIAPLLFGLNASTVVALAFVHGFEAAVATTAVIWLESVVIERTIIGTDTNKAMLIVSSKSEEICAALMTELHRGVTRLHAKGGYRDEERDVVYTVLTTRQLAHARKLVEDIDPTCFTTVLNATEVIGEGFRPLPI